MVKSKKLYVFMAIFFAIVTSICVCFGFTYSSKRVLKYSENGSVDYKVYLKDNDFFDVPYLEKGRKYIASLIDHIDIDYNYKFSSNQCFDYKLSYYIEAYTSVMDSSSTKKVMYDKGKKVIEPKTIEFKNKPDAETVEKISIRYDEYNEIIKQFVNKYGVSSSVSNLDLRMVINLEATTDGFENVILDKSEIALSIPLATLAIDVEIEYKEIDNRGEKLERSNSKLINQLFFIVSIISLIICILFLVKAINNRQFVQEQTTPYEKLKNNILYRYNNVVVHIKTFPKDVFDRAVFIDSIEDMVLISDILSKPILYKELKFEELSWFLIIDEVITYIYTLE